LAKLPDQNEVVSKGKGISHKGPLASQLPAPSWGLHLLCCCPLLWMAIDAEACLAPYEGHQVVEALTAGKKTLKLLHLQDHLTSSSADLFFYKKNSMRCRDVWTHVSLTACGDRFSLRMNSASCPGCFRQMTMFNCLQASIIFFTWHHFY
jgi:hypothetical protein